MKYDDTRDFGFTKPFDNLINLENIGFNVNKDVNRIVKQSRRTTSKEKIDEQKG